MAFQLRHCVIHELVKESGKQRVEAIIKQVLPTDDKYVQELVKSLNDLIGKKENQAARGTFDIEDPTYRVPKEGANKQVISSQADSLIKISRIWADFFPANTSNQPI